MLKRYQLIVFDWEGTIAENSLGYLISALTSAAERLHLPDFDLELARQVMPLGVVVAVRQLFPSLSLYQQEDLCMEAQKAILEVAATVQLVPGIKELIQYLHTEGLHLAIATNKSAQGLARVLTLSGLDDYIHVTRSATEAPAKPCPQMLQEIMDVFSMKPEQTLMVGDSSSDMEMAAALHVDAVGMDFFHTEESLLRAAGANHVCHDYAQLFQYINTPIQG